MRGLDRLRGRVRGHGDGPHRVTSRLLSVVASAVVLAGCAGSPTPPATATVALSGGTNASAYVKAGYDLATQGQKDKAVEAFTKAIELDPTLVVAFRNRVITGFE